MQPILFALDTYFYKFYFKKILLLIGFISLSQSICHAQNLILSKALDANNEILDFNLLGKHGDGFYLFQVYKKEAIIHRYNLNDMKLERSTNLDFLKDKEEIRFLLLIKNKIFIYSTFPSDEKEYLQQYVFDLDKDTIFDAVIIDTLVKNTTAMQTDLLYALSHDKTTHGILFTSSHKSDNPWHVSLWDSHTGKNIYKKILDPQEKTSTDALEMLVSNQRQILLTYQTNLNEGNLFRTSVNLNNRIWKISASEILEKQYKHNDFQINNLHWTLDNTTQNLVALGLYSSDHKRGQEGTCLLKWKLGTMELLQESYEPFAAPLLELLKSKRDKLQAYEVVRVIPTLEGGLYAILENRNVSYFSNANITTQVPQVLNDRNRYGKIYEYENLLLVNYTSTERSYIKVLYKSQYSENDDAAYSSFGLLNYTNHLEVIFNESISLNTRLLIYDLYADGTYRQNLLMETYEEKVLLLPSRAQQIDLHTMMIPSLINNKLQLLKYTTE